MRYRVVENDLYVLFTKSTVATLKIEYCFVETFGSKIGPMRLSEVKFSICNLPQQEITDSGFAAGSNEQVRIWNAVCG